MKMLKTLFSWLSKSTELLFAQPTVRCICLDVVVMSLIASNILMANDTTEKVTSREIIPLTQEQIATYLLSSDGQQAPHEVLTEEGWKDLQLDRLMVRVDPLAATAFGQWGIRFQSHPVAGEKSLSRVQVAQELLNNSELYACLRQELAGIAQGQQALLNFWDPLKQSNLETGETGYLDRAKALYWSKGFAKLNSQNYCLEAGLALHNIRDLTALAFSWGILRTIAMTSRAASRRQLPAITSTLQQIWQDNLNFFSLAWRPEYRARRDAFMQFDNDNYIQETITHPDGYTYDTYRRPSDSLKEGLYSSRGVELAAQGAQVQRKCQQIRTAIKKIQHRRDLSPEQRIAASLGAHLLENTYSTAAAAQGINWRRMWAMVPPHMRDERQLAGIFNGMTAYLPPEQQHLVQQLGQQQLGGDRGAQQLLEGLARASRFFELEARLRTAQDLTPYAQDIEQANETLGQVLLGLQLSGVASMPGVHEILLDNLEHVATFTDNKAGNISQGFTTAEWHDCLRLERQAHNKPLSYPIFWNSLRMATCLPAIIATYICSKALIKREHILRTMHAELVQVAQLLQHAHNLSVIGQESSILTDSEAFKQLQNFFADSAVSSAPLRELLAELKTATFAKPSALLFYRGRVLKTYRLLQEIKHELVPLLQALAKIDGMVAIATFGREHQHTKANFSIPKLLDEQGVPVISVHYGWLPLIDADKAVANTFAMGKNNPNAVILTGPNGTGKSAIMKMMAYVYVLAQSWGMVPAKKVEITPVTRVLTYIAPEEDVTKNLSTFMSQKVRADNIVSSVKLATQEDRFFVVIDEPFSGTVELQAAGLAAELAYTLGNDRRDLLLLATHFEAPTKLSQTSENFANYQLQVDTDPHTGKPVRRFVLLKGSATWWFDTSPEAKERQRLYIEHLC